MKDKRFRVCQTESGGSYSDVVGSFDTFEEAKKFAEEFAQHGYRNFDKDSEFIEINDNEDESCCPEPYIVDCK